ncbi:hypothetical protein KKE06_03730 [Candidatus Micrarchaeota archaeon]|nr:hypothetical protein [Candidatus Micrarchaeota archaeon]MBU1930358.1 hypothetical protein [Candidatus Micrarchaeota archaeon]
MNKQKGQVSLEIVILIIVILTAFSALTLMAENSKESQEILALQNQAKVIAHNVAHSITALAILSNTASTSIEIPTPSLMIVNPTYGETCTISLASGNVIVEIDRDGGGTDITIERAVFLPSSWGSWSNNISGLECGETIIIN